MTPLHLVRLHQCPILQQLQWEEALLRGDYRNFCLINTGSPPAIVMGISGKTEDHINEEVLSTFQIPLLRRFSGGGTVVVNEETIFITLICNSLALPIHSLPRSIMQWTATHLFSPLFSNLPFQLQENDYTLGDRKWGGNAQAIIKDRWLHHTSILWDFCPHLMRLLKIPPKIPGYRQKRTHLDFVCGLKNHYPSKEIFLDLFVAQLRQHFIVIEENKELLEEIAKKPHRKATTVVM